MTRWSAEQVAGLAPDGAGLAAGRGLARIERRDLTGWVDTAGGA